MVCAAQEPFLRDLQRCVQQARKDFGREVMSTCAMDQPCSRIVVEASHCPA
jgi:hypothetical protein